MNAISFIESIDKIKTVYHKNCEKIVEEFNISVMDFNLIMFFANNLDKNTAKDFSKMRNVKPNVVSLHVDKLVSSGYLERQEVVGDRRKIKLICTSKTSEIVSKGRDMQKDFYLELTKGISKDEMASFKKTYLTILDNTMNLNK